MPKNEAIVQSLGAEKVRLKLAWILERSLRDETCVTFFVYSRINEHSDTVQQSGSMLCSTQQGH
jgi:hypothetical protein